METRFYAHDQHTSIAFVLEHPEDKEPLVKLRQEITKWLMLTPEGREAYQYAGHNFGWEDVHEHCASIAACSDWIISLTAEMRPHDLQVPYSEPLDKDLQKLPPWMYAHLFP